jgi:antitoxin ChpS
MITSTLRTVGGSVMLAIPKSVLEGLGLGPNQKVDLRIDGGRLVIEPRTTPRYGLDQLMAQCDLAAPPEASLAEWDEAAPEGREVL